jgi:hypothetical protein
MCLVEGARSAARVMKSEVVAAATKEVATGTRVRVESTVGEVTDRDGYVMIQTGSITPATGRLMKATGMATSPSLFATGGGMYFPSRCALWPNRLAAPLPLACLGTVVGLAPCRSGGRRGHLGGFGGGRPPPLFGEKSKQLWQPFTLSNFPRDSNRRTIRWRCSAGLWSPLCWWSHCSPLSCLWGRRRNAPCAAIAVGVVVSCGSLSRGTAERGAARPWRPRRCPPDPEPPRSPPSAPSSWRFHRRRLPASPAGRSRPRSAFPRPAALRRQRLLRVPSGSSDPQRACRRGLIDEPDAGP